jgi:hypothetical protein
MTLFLNLPVKEFFRLSEKILNPSDEKEEESVINEGKDVKIGKRTLLSVSLLLLPFVADIQI